MIIEILGTFLSLCTAAWVNNASVVIDNNLYCDIQCKYWINRTTVNRAIRWVQDAKTRCCVHALAWRKLKSVFNFLHARACARLFLNIFLNFLHSRACTHHLVFASSLHSANSSLDLRLKETFILVRTNLTLTNSYITSTPF